MGLAGALARSEEVAPAPGHRGGKSPRRAFSGCRAPGAQIAGNDGRLRANPEKRGNRAGKSYAKARDGSGKGFAAGATTTFRSIRLFSGTVRRFALPQPATRRIGGVELGERAGRDERRGAIRSLRPPPRPAKRSTPAKPEPVEGPALPCGQVSNGMAGEDAGSPSPASARRSCICG